MDLLRVPEGSRLRNRRGTNKKNEPAPGTKLRETWDLFQANRGKPIQISFSARGHNRRQLDDLRDYYFLDIISPQRGYWMLAGRWIGDDYESYTQTD